MSADRVKWEHIQGVFELCKGMFQRLQGGLKCTEELSKGYYQKDPQTNTFIVF